MDGEGEFNGMFSMETLLVVELISFSLAGYCRMMSAYDQSCLTVSHSTAGGVQKTVSGFNSAV